MASGTPSSTWVDDNDNLQTMLILRIFVGIVPTLVGTKKWKPEKEELEKELRRLGLAKEDVKMSKLEDEIVLDPADPIENVEYIKSTFKY